MTKRYVPDTNFFLQFKLASELPWVELTDADHIQLVVVDGVIAELDRHKAGGNERRSRRARDYLQLLAPLFEGQEGHEEVVVRDRAPKVSFVFAPYRPNAEPGPLSETNADAMIVNQAHGAHSDTDPLEVLTADRMMTVHARRAGLKSKMLKDEWRLAPEPSPADRELRELRRQLAEVKAIAPDLSVTIVGLSTPSSLLANADWTTPLPDGLVDSAVDRVTVFYPDERAAYGRITDYSRATSVAYETARGIWLGQVADQIRRLPGLLNASNANTRVIIEISNRGGSAAEGLVVEIEGCGDVAVADTAEHESLAKRAVPCASISRPPRLSDFESPISSRGRKSDHIEPLRIPPIPTSRLPREFYWTSEGADGVHKLTGQCAEFRHHIHIGRRAFLVLALPSSEPAGSVKGVVKIRLSAKNLVRPIEIMVPVVIELKRRNAFAELEAVLQKRLVQQ